MRGLNEYFGNIIKTYFTETSHIVFEIFYCKLNIKWNCSRFAPIKIICNRIGGCPERFRWLPWNSWWDNLIADSHKFLSTWINWGFAPLLTFWYPRLLQTSKIFVLVSCQPPTPHIWIESLLIILVRLFSQISLATKSQTLYFKAKLVPASSPDHML